MTDWPIHARIDGPIVMIGFGSIGRGTLPLIERHFKFDRSRMVVIDPRDDDRKLLDERGIAHSPKLLAPGEAVPAGAQLLELTPKGGQWTFVSDAWFFKEGEAARWQPAKYGEFRVTPEGKGLLVRVVGEDLKPL